MNSATLRTRVVFRLHKGEVLALFPEIAGNSNPDFCQSYALKDGHAPAHYHGVISASRPATNAEAFATTMKLMGIGYDLQIVKRAKASDWHARYQQTRSPSAI